MFLIWYLHPCTFFSDFRNLAIIEISLLTVNFLLFEVPSKVERAKDVRNLPCFESPDASPLTYCLFLVSLLKCVSWHSTWIFKNKVIVAVPSCPTSLCNCLQNNRKLPSIQMYLKLWRFLEFLKMFSHIFNSYESLVLKTGIQIFQFSVICRHPIQSNGGCPTRQSLAEKLLVEWLH